MPTDKNEDEQKYFIKELTKYYVDFLETDFHKRKNPKRSIKHRNEDNLLIGLNTNKYPDFNNLVWKLINHGFNKDILNKIQKGVYKINIPRNQLLDIIKIQTDQISIKGIGRFCRYCKGITDTIIVKPKEPKSDNVIQISGSRFCSKCGSNMILRNGRYGKFYGCSKFPYCKGTMSYSQ